MSTKSTFDIVRKTKYSAGEWVIASSVVLNLWVASKFIYGFGDLTDLRDNIHLIIRDHIVNKFILRSVLVVTAVRPVYRSSESANMSSRQDTARCTAGACIHSYWPLCLYSSLFLGSSWKTFWMPACPGANRCATCHLLPLLLLTTMLHPGTSPIAM